MRRQVVIIAISKLCPLVLLGGLTGKRLFCLRIFTDVIYNEYQARNIGQA